ncbi:MAG: HAD-IC family P-type ATPase [Myxococcales bacterium]|nr:HAD-IC family P-type ATPase [Myxococcales bacterium]MDD9968522.1 HAD-IC family P-type ATPase [Myxococcales bacterium]
MAEPASFTDRQEPSVWHTGARGEVFERLHTQERGLSDAEAARRLHLVGPNRLPERRPPTRWQVFARQFRSPLIYVLALAGGVSLAIGEAVDAAFIFGILVLNAVLGGVQEWKAERSSQALQKLLRVRATVVRDGDLREVDADDVAPGDVVALEPGNRVPADARLIAAQGLEVDESLLTGESVPVMKDADWSGPQGVLLGDRMNMIHAGSTVARGRATGVVVATGKDTAVGQLAMEVVRQVAGKPPLLERLERFIRVIGMAVLLAALLVAAVGILVQGHSVAEMFFFAVALAVSAIPEGLPVALTVALAVATNRMAKRGVIVRKLAAVEGLGSCTLIASDKTGTLTCNALTVRLVSLPDGAVLDVGGEGYIPEGAILERDNPPGTADRKALERLVRAASLCNEGHLYRRDDAWSFRGDPTDVALLVLARKAGCSQEQLLAWYPQINQIPFEPERQYAATFHGSDGRTRVMVKGAPERVLPMCHGMEGGRGATQMARAQELAAGGYRVLALADGEQPGELDPVVTPGEPSDLEFLGFVGMMDPLRPDVDKAVAACTAAGIRVTMVTGDHPVTALSIARALGLAKTMAEVMTGADVERLSGPLPIDRVRVFARVAPAQKLSIVRAAREAGHFVAVTGDGVNDAPALRASNIGVAMGQSGTDVAREAAELVITDDNFATIVSGIEEGRVAYDNIRNVIYLLVSTGAAEVVLVLLSVVTGLPLPLLPVQLLWLNLVTNGIQDVALAFEPGQDRVLERAPRPPRQPIFDRLMIERTVIAAIVMGGLGFWTFQWMLSAGASLTVARNSLLTLMVLFENVHLGNCRSETASLFTLSPLRSPILLAGAATAFLVHIAALLLAPAQAVLRTAPISASHWATLIATACSLAVVMELHKLSWRWRGRTTSATARDRR